MIGFAFCGSFCSFERSVNVLSELVGAGMDVLPIMSETAYSTDTRFGAADAWKSKISALCGRDIIHTIVGAEPLGPKISLDALVICPCTGNTLSKLASGMTDTAVCMAAKAHLRCDRPLIIALASNDALSANLENIAALLKRKNIYFTPMKQDDPVSKPHSLVADFGKVSATLSSALLGKQPRPLFLE
ncbi:MAG: dipicolinate synthase subunit B [Ruminococcaceae bacterium]|nr:dipicolinate synthase subunit B [Oscillospiraceae bacterium]